MEQNKYPDEYLRECGGIEGDISPLYPFIWIGRLGLYYYKDIQRRRCFRSEGIFVVRYQLTGNRKDYYGIIIPLSLCRDKKAGAIVDSIINKAIPILAGVDYPYSNIFKDELNKIISRHAGLDCLSSYLNPCEGLIPLTLTEKLFQWIRKNFLMVREIKDNTQNLPVAISRSGEIPWQSVYDFVTHHSVLNNPFHDEPLYKFHCAIFYGNIKDAKDDIADLRAMSASRRFEIKRYKRSFNEFFQLRNMIKPDLFEVGFTQKDEEGNYMMGWIDFVLKTQDLKVLIHLSDCFPPYQRLYKWLKAIERNSLPVAFDIDEEGIEKTLIAYPTDNSDYMYFQVLDTEGWDVLFHALVNRNGFLHEIRTKLKHFIENEYNDEAYRFNLRDIKL